MIDIKAYQPEHESDLIQAISMDSDWHEFTNDKTIGSYKAALESSVTHVAYSGPEFCGFIRAIADEGLAIYISELYVVPKWRKQQIGQSLVEHIVNDFPDIDVYVLSDEDLYYEKKGCKKVGSVFQLNSTQND